MIDTVLSSFRDLTDFLAAGDRPGTEITRSHSWPWAPSLCVLIMIAAATYVIWIYARERAAGGRRWKPLLIAIRVALIGLVLFMLYGWMLHRHRTDLPDLVVVMDDSQSMVIEDQIEDPQREELLTARLERAGLDRRSRLDLAKLILLEPEQGLLDQTQDRYRLKIYRIGGSGREQTMPIDRGATEPPLAEAWDDVLREIEANETNSRLGKSVRDVLEAQRGRPTAAIVVLSDGITTEGKTLGEIAPYARRKAVPLYLVGLGNDRPPRDIRLSDLLVDDVVFVGDQINFDFRVASIGFAGRRARAQLFLKEQPNTALDETEIVLGEDGQSKPVRLAHRPEKEGDFAYVIQVDSLEGEANSENNQENRLVRVRDETLRVLFVQDYPSFEFRYLKSMLSRGLKQGRPERAIELTTVLQDSDLDYTELDETATRVFPVSREVLFRYDVLVFGDVNPSFLSRSVMENIAAFVEQRGGGLVMLAGPQYTPLAYRDTPLEKLLPIDLNTTTIPSPDAVLDEPLAILPTQLGLSSPQFRLGENAAESLRIWRTMPAAYWMLAAADLRSGVRVLAEEPSSRGAGGRRLPMVCMHFVGAGKVIFHASDESYRWAKHPAGDAYYERYWIQTIRYLSRSKLLEGNRLIELQSDRNEYRRGEPVRLRTRFLDDRLAPVRDDGVTLMLEQQGGRRRQLTLRRDAVHRGVFEGLASNLADGEYRVWLATPNVEGNPPSQMFSVVAPPGEQARVEMDAADLQLAAKTSQGQFYTLATADRLANDLPRGRQVRIESLPPIPIWNSSLLAGLFVVLILSEWMLRKRVGLL